MRHAGVGRSDIEASARLSGINGLEGGQEATLERNGKISTLKDERSA